MIADADAMPATACARLLELKNEGLSPVEDGIVNAPPDDHEAEMG